MKLPDSPRIGTWTESHVLYPFRELGRYVGPPLPRKLVGQHYTQELEEGTVVFRLGVLYDHSMPRKRRLETVLILESGPAAMWDYDCWLRTN